MFRNKIILLILIGLFIIPQQKSFAQDSTKTKKEKWEWDMMEFGDWIHWGKKMPTISLNYGFTDIEHEKISEPFATTNLIELKLGHTNRRTSRYAKNILKYDFRYLYISNISTKLAGGSTNQNELKTNTWRFGISRSNGYGYKLGNAAVILYYTYSFDWSRVDFQNPATGPQTQNTIDRFNDSFRFGTSNEGGIRILATSLITLEAGYERSIIFERHLFWKWAGSGLIEVISQGLLDSFIREIFKSSPAAGTIVYFLLKNALSYGLYELRQEKMNWPFPSAPPLSLDSFKFGVTFTF